MTSNINFSAIDEQFPVAGKDNNSQGFRDNFNVIRSGLATAKSEITDLQSKSLLNQDLITTDPVINDLQGSSITNGFYNNFHGTSYIASAAGSANIVVSAASVHVYTLSSSTAFTFTDWPATTRYAKIKVHFVGTGATSHIASLFSTGGGDVRLDNDFPIPFTIANDGTHYVIEAWSYNDGATVFVKYLGSF